jgi:type I restriction enzyme S subunit
MAKPFLRCPCDWLTGTLEADPLLGLIAHVDSGGTPSTTNSDFWDGDVPWLTPKEITGFTDGVYVSQTERQITQSGLKHSGAKLLPVGTVLLTKRAPVGIVAINAVPMSTNQGFLNFQCGPKLRPLYLAYWLRVNRVYLDAVANGSTYPELYKSDLFEFEISVPSLEGQDAILEIISALQYATLLGLPLEQSLTSIDSLPLLQKQDRRLRDIRDALLPKLFSGQLTPSKVSPYAA